jgi:transposase-like protein
MSEGRSGFDPKVMAALVPGPITAAEANDLIHGFKKAVFERALGAELTHHLGYGQDEPKPTGQTNHRNGSSAKTAATDTGEVRVEIPRGEGRSTPASDMSPLKTPRPQARSRWADDRLESLNRGPDTRTLRT